MNFANTKNQSLLEHSFAVGELSKLLIERLNLNKTSEDIIGDKVHLAQLAKLAGFFHDIGKIDPQFQKYLASKKVTDSSLEDGVHINSGEKDPFSFNNYIRHNELSFALLDALLSVESDNILELMRNIDSIDVVKYIVYWHHAKVLRNKENSTDFNTAEKILSAFITSNPNYDYRAEFVDFVAELTIVEKIYNESVNVNHKQFEYSSIIMKRPVLRESLLPSFKQNYKHDKNKIFEELNDSLEACFNKEAKKNLLRSVVITADRIVSGLSNKELSNHIKNKTLNTLFPIKEKGTNKRLMNSIQEMENRFEEKSKNNSNILKRNEKQKEVVKKLIQHSNPTVLSGPAGCGKTKIFLQWIKEKNAKQAFIIAPRNMICKSLFDSLISQYLPNSTIEIYTGEYKLIYQKGETKQLLENEEFQADIVVTTIDTLVNSMLSHNRVDSILQFLNAHIVFDEYHEFFNLSGLVLLFKEFVLLKSLLQESNTLLVSATPNYFFLDFLGIDNKCIEEIETFNKEEYQFEFIAEENEFDISLNEMNKVRNPGDIVIFNTATQSQVSSLYNRKHNYEYNINYHSKFTIRDKNILINEVMNMWGEDSKEKERVKVLRSGPILQASLNLSTYYIKTESCSAENWCQRLGRLNRFATKGKIGKLCTIYDVSLNKERVQKHMGGHKFLATIHMLEQTIEWIKYLKKNKFEKTNLEKIYNLYKDFHKEEKTKEAYKKDFLAILSESIKKFSDNFFDPINLNLNKKDKKTLKRYSLRGSNVYILPVKIDIPLKIDDNKSKPNWLYIPHEENLDTEVITWQHRDLGMFADAQKNYNPFIEESKSKYKKYKKATLNTMIKGIINEARNKETPLIVSYLNQPYKGLYYVTNESLLIGLIQIEKIIMYNEEVMIYKIVSEQDVRMPFEGIKDLIKKRIKELEEKDKP